VVIAVDGAEVDDMQGLNYRIATHKPGDVVKLRVATGGQQRDVAVTLALPPENPPRQTATVAGHNPLTGARIENLSPAVATDLQIDLMEKGVVVVSVADGSIAANQGFQPGDIVKSVNGVAIGSVGQLQGALGAAGAHWDMVIDRGGQRMTLSVSD
jgi:serine protease Do